MNKLFVSGMVLAGALLCSCELSNGYAGMKNNKRISLIVCPSFDELNSGSALSEMERCRGVSILGKFDSSQSAQLLQYGDMFGSCRSFRSMADVWRPEEKRDGFLQG